jgi:hypothetical protein
MDLNTSHNAPSLPEQISLTKSYFLQKKELYGGMPTAIGQDHQCMVPSLFCLLREQLIHFPSLMKNKL